MSLDKEFATLQDALSHYGVKGMKWGQRKAAGSAGTMSRGQARQEVASLATDAGQIIRESRRAETASARKKAADKYEKQVLQRVKSPEFKAAYQRANTMGKGEMAAHVLITGPFAALTIPMVKAQYAAQRRTGVDFEIDLASDVLREMRRL